MGIRKGENEKMTNEEKQLYETKKKQVLEDLKKDFELRLSRCKTHKQRKKIFKAELSNLRFKIQEMETEFKNEYGQSSADAKKELFNEKI